MWKLKSLYSPTQGKHYPPGSDWKQIVGPPGCRQSHLRSTIWFAPYLSLECSDLHTICPIIAPINSASPWLRCLLKISQKISLLPYSLPRIAAFASPHGRTAALTSICSHRRPASLLADLLPPDTSLHPPRQLTSSPSRTPAGMAAVGRRCRLSEHNWPADDEVGMGACLSLAGGAEIHPKQ
jgi:hypothetical protein